ncbi:MAG: radical SAM protein [Fervidobacterium sp.]
MKIKDLTVDKKTKIYPVFLPNAGCKKRCVFCNQHIMTGEELLSIDKIKDEIGKLINFETESESRTIKIDEIAFYGGTFTGLKTEVIDKLLSIFPSVPKRISTKPDAINEEIIEHLLAGNVKVVELGIESLDDAVLLASNRGYNAKIALEAIELIKAKFNLTVHLMVGLPLDSREKDLETVKKLIKAGVKEFRIHPTIVFKDTILEKMYHEKTYKPLDLEEAVDIVSDLVMLIESNDGKVLRLGYHVPQTQTQYIVAGPYHPSFGDIVRARIIRKIVREFKIKKITYNKKFFSWVNSYGNKQLPVEKEIMNNNTRNINCDTLLFDGIPLDRILKMYVRKFI